jgi:hypothetical protein
VCLKILYSAAEKKDVTPVAACGAISDEEGVRICVLIHLTLFTCPCTYMHLATIKVHITTAPKSTS